MCRYVIPVSVSLSGCLPLSFGSCMLSGYPTVLCPSLKLTRPPSCCAEPKKSMIQL